MSHTNTSHNPDRTLWCSWAALVSAIASTAGSIYLSLGLGLIACPICYYQRTFAIAVLMILAIGVLSPLRATHHLNVLALAPTVGGMAIAMIHTWLDAVGQQICPQGLFGLGTSAQQSLTSYVMIIVPLIVGIRDDIRAEAITRSSTVVAILLGGSMAVLCVIASPEVPMLDQHDPLICYRPTLPK